MKSINQIKKNIKNNGYVFLPGLLKNSKSITEFINDVRKIISLRIKKIKVSEISYKQNDLNSSIFMLNKINEKNISFINDVMNSSPSLQKLFNEPKLLKIVDQLLKSDHSYLCVNNHKFRIQVPGRDEISNLPWHQDSHYNTMGDKNTSIVVWISLSNISYDQGPVILKKGSHKLGKLRRIVTHRKNGNKIFTVSKKIINDNKFKKISFESNIGDVMLIDMNLIHASGANNSTHLSKLSAQARYHQAANKNFLTRYDI